MAARTARTSRRGRRVYARTTQDYLNEIARLIGREPRSEGKGGSEPKAFLVDVVEALDLDLNTRLKKEKLAESICLSAGVPWDATCDSRSTNSLGGGTITNEGLERLLKAVRRLVAEREAS